jgi:hypothetical protein
MTCYHCGEDKPTHCVRVWYAGEPQTDVFTADACQDCIDRMRDDGDAVDLIPPVEFHGFPKEN